MFSLTDAKKGPRVHFLSQMGMPIFHRKGRYTRSIAVTGLYARGKFLDGVCYVDKSWVLEPF
jgi:hypothetical protein